MDTLLILVAIIALIAIAWIVLSLLRGRNTAAPAASGPVTTAYERELADANAAKSVTTAAGDTEPGHVDNLRTGAAAAGAAGAAAASSAAATVAGAGASATAPSSPLSTAYEAELADSGARHAPAPDARDMAENLRTDVTARDGTVAPAPGSSLTGTDDEVDDAAAAAHAGTLGLMAGAGVVAGTAADALRPDDSLLAPDVVPPLAGSGDSEAELGEEILRRRARAAQVERDVEESRRLAENAERSPFAGDSGTRPERRDDAAAGEFIETPLPDPAPADAAAATGGLGAVTMGEPDGPFDDEDERPRPGFST